MSEYESRRRQAAELLDKVREFARSRGNSEVEKVVEEASLQLAGEKLIVVVAGEVKQGKSSLVNALLGEMIPLCPVDVDIATCLVTLVSHGPRERITVQLADGEDPREVEIERRAIADYVTEQGNRGNFRRARLVRIELPKDQLSQGLTLVDTPGVGGLNADHTDIAYAFLPAADAVLFVSDAHAPLAVEELSFIERIARHCGELLFVMTKIDSAPGYLEVMEQNKAKLTKLLGLPQEKIRILPVSARNKLAYLASLDDEDLQDSRFPALEREIWESLGNRRGGMVLLRAANGAVRALGQLERPLSAELSGCQQTTKDEVDFIDKRLAEAKERLQGLLASNADWRTEMADGLLDLRTAVLDRFQEEFVQIQRRAAEHVEDPRLLEQPGRVVSMVEADVDAAMTVIGREIGEGGSRLHEQLQGSTGLDLEPFETASLAAERASLRTTAGEQKKQTWWERSLDAARYGSFNMTAGGLIGTVVGGTLGGIVGLAGGVAGAAAGAAIGAKIGSVLLGAAGLKKGVQEGIEATKRKQREFSKKELSAVLFPYVADCQRLGRRAVEGALRELERSLRDDLTRQIRQERDSCEASLGSLQQGRKLTQEAAARKAAELRGQLSTLATLRKRASDLGTAIPAPARAEKPAAVKGTAPRRSHGAAPVRGADHGEWADE